MPAVLKETVCTHKITRLAIDKSTGSFWVRLQGLDCYVSGKQILSSKIVHAREAQFITVPVPDSWGARASDADISGYYKITLADRESSQRFMELKNRLLMYASGIVY